MSYQKHTWVTNEIIRGKQLNHIEDGIYDEEQRAKNAEELLDARIDEIVVENGAYKVVLDHTQVSQPSSKYIYLEPDPQATGNDKFTEWVYVYNETLETYEWKMIGDVSIDLSDYVQNTDYASSSAFGVVKVDGVTIIANNGVISAAAQATGVTSFNGRSGAVSPQSGDYTAADVGLENVGNFKAVSTQASQGLSVLEQTNARNNIGAGTSSFSGDYADLTNNPTLGTAAALDVATSGDASSTEVVKGDDTRLTDSRTPTAHNHTTSDITNFPSLGTAASLDVAASGNAGTNEVVKGNDTRLTDSRTPTAHTHTTSDITNLPSFGTAASLDVAASGDASTTQVVKGDDSRLTDSRTPTSHTHTVSDISDLPTIPTKTSDLTNDSGFIDYKAVSTVASQGLSDTEKSNARANIGVGCSQYYGTCSTAAATQTKTVTVSADQNFRLHVGARVTVKFSNSNTYSATASAPCMLNVNSTGAKNIYYNNTATPTGTNTTAFGYANRIASYIYDGTYWVWDGMGSEADTRDFKMGTTRSGATANTLYFVYT